MGRHKKEFDETTDEYVGTIRNSAAGPYKVIGMKNSFTYTVQFLYSGCIRDTVIKHIRTNGINDPFHGINPAIVHYSNLYGPFIILNITSDLSNNTYAHNNLYKIRFLNTGTEKFVKPVNIILGNIADENALHRTHLDMALIQPNFIEKRLIRFKNNVYVSMMRRCYNENNDNYKSYGKIGIRVCDEWSNPVNGKANFFNDVQYIDQYQKWARYPTLYQLDKDYRQLYLPKSERIYSVSTCIFLHNNDNSNLRTIENNNGKYYGVYYNPERHCYYASLHANETKYVFGYFNNEEFAAAVYNYYYDKFHPYELIPLKNTNLPYFSEEDIVKHSHPVKLYSVVKDDMNYEELEDYVNNYTYNKYKDIEDELYKNTNFVYDKYAFY